MIEKQQPIVALGHSTKPKKARPPRNNLLLNLKKDDLELNFYSSLDTEIMNKLLEKVLSWLGSVIWVKSILFVARRICVKALMA